jgi:hypothetical protein
MTPILPKQPLDALLMKRVTNPLDAEGGNQPFEEITNRR